MAAITSLTCPACLEAYEPAPSLLVPMLYPCLHNACKACVEARELGDVFSCPVCQRVDGPPAVDHVLAAYCSDVVDCIDDVDTDGETRAAQSRRADPALAALAPLCEDLAARLLVKSEEVMSSKDVMDVEFVELVSGYTGIIDHLHDQLSGQVGKYLKDAADLCQSHVEAMDTEVEELQETLAQLRQALVICEDASATPEAQAAAKEIVDLSRKWEKRKINAVTIQLSVDQKAVDEVLAKVSTLSPVGL